MKILVVGGGGREHALCWAISKSPLCDALYCAPGNPGIAQVAQCIDVKAEDLDGIEATVLETGIDFVVVGPEAPLVAGLADRLSAKGIKVFGPSADASRLEGSKAFTKGFLARHGIPTGAYQTFTDAAAAKDYVKAHGAPIVVKADGLAAGKGVVVASSQQEALDAIDMMITDGAFGEAGAKLVIEEMLDGEEASFFALIDGEKALPLIAAQDHKRAFDGDEGPNTGGMGAYSPTPIVDQAMTDRIMAEIVDPTVAGMQAEGMPFKGVLFVGLMIHPEKGPKVIEYNVRFGDPECQVLVMRLQSDLLPALLATADGTLDTVDLAWRDEAALSVIMATKGYPGRYDKGSVIRGADQATDDAAQVFHAGTSIDQDGALIATGGRVLAVTACSATLSKAQEAAYTRIAEIDWPGGFYRKDIGWRALG